MSRYFLIFFLFCCASGCGIHKQGVPAQAWIRINQLGYTPEGVKVAVWGSKAEVNLQEFVLKEATTGRVVYRAGSGKAFGAYGPFTGTYRLDFSAFADTGRFYLEAGNARSPAFRVHPNVYAGTADFVLRYLRQQRSGYNPYLKDSCHTLDGYTMYGPMPDSTLIDVSGGWHDASDYLQYATTSANATYHLLAAYRDFGSVFSDQHAANGSQGQNGVADVMDEARWGLDWLLKMHPRADWLFNQIADDRDHAGMRLPTLDSVDYGMGKGGARPVYFVTGEPQGLGKYQNRATGAASIAGKFTSAFALAAQLYQPTSPEMAQRFHQKALSAYRLGLDKPGVAQTAPHLAPYFYEEDNWVDDMELAAANLWKLTEEDTYRDQALAYARKEKTTPWMGADTARHYQWYPFHNFGHDELSTQMAGMETMGYYKAGIEQVWNKAKHNAFYRGVPFIWCSNNLTTSFAIQCMLYRKQSGDTAYRQLEQANIDWLLGCNPWGTSMVYGLPEEGDTPVDPHSAFTRLYQYPVDGGLVDGPVYTSIYSNLIGITLHHPDEYAAFQSDLAVYHDDFGDYSTNEPTMDGTASLVYLMAALEHQAAGKESKNRYSLGAIVRGDTTQKKLALILSADVFNDGKERVQEILSNYGIKAGFFLTGNFYRNPENRAFIQYLKKDGHYLSGHSDKHLLYCDWSNRDSLLVDAAEFRMDLKNNFKAMAAHGLEREETYYFLPPYEWYNTTISQWFTKSNLQLINFTAGTNVTADYTWPEMGKRYKDSDTILNSIMDYEARSAVGLNGFILLVHLGTDPRRTDKFYDKLPLLLNTLTAKGYRFERIDSLLN